MQDTIQEVENATVDSTRTLGEHASGMIDKIEGKLSDWYESFMLMLPNILIAILVLVGAYFLSRLIKRLSFRALKTISDNTQINRLLSNIITIIVMLAGLFIALGVLELDKTVTSLLAGAGVAGLAIGLAFQEPIVNTVSGVILAVRKTYNSGDLVETNDYLGHVSGISLRDTTLTLLSGEVVVIPNKMIVQNPFTNYTLADARRITVECGVGYSDDLEGVRTTALEAIKTVEGIDHDRKVECMFTGFGDSSINFMLRFWTDKTPQANFLELRSEAIIALKKALDKNGYNIPFPIRTLDIPSLDVTRNGDENNTKGFNIRAAEEENEQSGGDSGKSYEQLKGHDEAHTDSDGPNQAKLSGDRDKADLTAEEKADEKHVERKREEADDQEKAKGNSEKEKKKKDSGDYEDPFEKSPPSKGDD